jgi:hypothetical protein
MNGGAVCVAAPTPWAKSGRRHLAKSCAGRVSAYTQGTPAGAALTTPTFSTVAVSFGYGADTSDRSKKITRSDCIDVSIDVTERIIISRLITSAVQLSRYHSGI